MQVYAAKPGDNKDTINRKAFHLSRLQHQTVTSYSFIEIANKIGGAFTGHTGTEFDLHEIVENDQTFYIINLHIEQQCESFRSMEKDEDIDLYKNSSYLRYHEEIRVSAADLASGSGDSLTVTTSPIEIRMDISPTVTPPN